MSISKLSDQELESHLLRFVHQERKLLHVILLHIREVDKRKLYLEKPRPSLFAYLVNDLGYSAPSAQRRVDASRLLKALPELAEKIQTGSVNLSQIGELHRAIKQKEKESTKVVSRDMKSELLCKIENKSTFETQVILAKELDLHLKPLASKQVQKDESVCLQITLSKAQYAKLQECKNLAAHILLKQNDTGTSAVLDVLMDSYIDEKNQNSLKVKPDKKAKTGEQLIADEEVNADEKLKAEVRLNEDKNTDIKNMTMIELAISSIHSSSIASTQNSISASEVKIDIHGSHLIKSESTKDTFKEVRSNKTLTPKTRRIILSTYQCCQYKNPQTQEICGSRFAREVDHQQPLWAGGDHQPENLTVLCSTHNKFRYRKQVSLR